MILTSNQQLLMKHFPRTWNETKRLDESRVSAEGIKVESAKNGMPTLLVELEARQYYLHSKYNPVQEAEKLIEQLEQADRYKHVFFYGIGMGYHIDALVRRFPAMSFSVYEPSPAIFYSFLSHRDMSGWPLSQLKNIAFGLKREDLAAYLTQFIDGIKEEVLVYVLPSYERVFADQYKAFANDFQSLLANKKSHFQVNTSFEKRWTTNSMQNLPETVRTPNALCLDDRFFRDKPVLLVAAGPSLQDEIGRVQNIIKEKRAYVFAAGSAIVKLLAHDIYPDAVFSYDPTPNNANVFVQMAQKGVRSIPLIYGSSVGFETLQNYPGPKMHMITSQDTIAPFYLKQDGQDQLKTVADAPSVSVMALQWMNQMGFNPIILVGQNFAYKNGQFYSSGAQYQHRSGMVTQAEMEQAKKVKDVHGSEVLSNDGLLRMKLEMEKYIAFMKDRIELINTTQGGAHIEGTSFLSLEEVMSDRLTDSLNKLDFSRPSDHPYNKEFLAAQAERMDQGYQSFTGLVQDQFKLLADLNKVSRTMNPVQAEKFFTKIDKGFKKIKKNKFYDAIILPMNRVQFELLQKQIAEIKFEKDLQIKAEKILQEFGKYLAGCQKDAQMILPVMEAMHAGIRSDIHKAPVFS